MKFCGKIAGLSKDMVTGKIMMALEVFPGDGALDGFEAVQDKDLLEIEIAKPKAMRSKNANAYFHVLIGEIAAAMNISRARCKNMLICRYGQPMLADDGSPLTLHSNVPEEKMMELTTMHTVPTGYTSDGLTIYALYRGTHEYTDKEMSILINGAVSEAVELGLETIAGDRLAEVKRRKAEVSGGGEKGQVKMVPNDGSKDEGSVEMLPLP